MATKAEQTAFINSIAPLIVKYAKQYGYHVASPIIAQACCESAYGKSTLASKYHNYFGLKCGSGWTGKSVNMSTREEYSSGLVTIRDNFRVYDSMEQGVIGYFEFLKYPRYSNLKSAKTPEEYLRLIKADGYATSSSYVNTNLNFINANNLRVWDSAESVQPVTIKTVNYIGIVTATALYVRSSYSDTASIQKVATPPQNFMLKKGLAVIIQRESSNGWGELAQMPDHWVSLKYIKKV